jgi:hypothetical protein
LTTEPESHPQSRLELAAWLTAADHPLTARVAVNRFWQQFFGTGIVKTSEDFGSQGEPPVHPEVLDMLATDFVDDHWDVKRLVRRLVMTQAYQRAGKSSTLSLQLDPENRLLGRGPRRRLDAEAIRDSALFVGGMLAEEMAGPSVRPPQPEGVWSAVAYPTSNTSHYIADKGANAQRRSLYTFWKRTSPLPQFTLFDAPSRERCTSRRERTNTPLQALVLMNEPQYFAAARGLLSSLPDEVSAIAALAIPRMYRQATSRQLSEVDRAELLKLYHDLLQIYTEQPQLVTELAATTPHEAALIIIASTILNLDATLHN